MSVYYDIKEHLIVRDRQSCEHITPKDDIVSTMQYQLSLLGALVLQENAYVDEFVLNADGVTYTFSGHEVTPELGQLMKALTNARDLELTLHYSFYYRGNNSVSQAAGPWALMELCTELREDDMNGIFYSAWCKAVCDGNAGTLYAFGNHNGTFHNGAVEAKPVSDYPAGIWYADTDVVVDMEDLPTQQVEKIVAVCRKLNELTVFHDDPQQLSMDDIYTPTSNPIDFSGDSVSYYMNDVRLRSAEDIQRLLTLFDELNEVTNGSCGYIGEYTDLSGSDARVMHINYNAKGLDRITVAAV